MNRRALAHFGILLRASRLLVPYSMDEMARAVRVGKPKVASWESGTALPTEAELAAIAVALRASADVMCRAAKCFGIGYDVLMVRDVASALPDPLSPRGSLEGARHQPPRSLPPCRDPRSGRFISTLQVARFVVRSQQAILAGSVRPPVGFLAEQHPT
jgi:transcriptional regulator with XRE-family HTH domain